MSTENLNDVKSGDTKSIASHQDNDEDKELNSLEEVVDFTPEEINDIRKKIVAALQAGEASLTADVNPQLFEGTRLEVKNLCKLGPKFIGEDNDKLLRKTKHALDEKWSEMTGESVSEESLSESEEDLAHNLFNIAQDQKGDGEEADFIRKREKAEKEARARAIDRWRKITESTRNIRDKSLSSESPVKKGARPRSPLIHQKTFDLSDVNQKDRLPDSTKFKKFGDYHYDHPKGLNKSLPASEELEREHDTAFYRSEPDNFQYYLKEGDTGAIFDEHSKRLESERFFARGKQYEKMIQLHKMKEEQWEEAHQLTEQQKYIQQNFNQSIEEINRVGAEILKCQNEMREQITSSMPNTQNAHITLMYNCMYRKNSKS